MTVEKRGAGTSAISGLQALIISTATRVGMGNLVGVVAAISAGGAGAVFWMWITALIGSSTAFVEATLAQLHKEKDPLRRLSGRPRLLHPRVSFRPGGPNPRRSAAPWLFASPVSSAGAASARSSATLSPPPSDNAFSIPPLYTTVALVALSAVIVLRQNATVKVLDLVAHHGGAIFS